MNKRILIFSALLIASFGAGCSHDSKQASTADVSLQARTGTVVEREVPRIISVHGTIQADNDAVLSSRAMGPVIRDRVGLGDLVRKGDVLLEIDERMSGGMLAQAQGALAQAKAAEILAATNLRRFQALYDAQACSQLELDMAVMQHETATGAVRQGQGAVDAATAVSNESMIRAPFDGVVVEKFVSVGDLVAPGRSLIRVQTKLGLDLSFAVRSADAAQLESGTVIQCKLDNVNRVVQATITEIAPSADPMTHSISVKARLNDLDSLAAGFTATAELPCEMTQMILAPRSALYETGGLQLVTVVDSSGMARTRAVTTGRVRGEEIEVISGLVAGEVVVLDRVGPIAEGTRIERKNG